MNRFTVALLLTTLAVPAAAHDGGLRPGGPGGLTEAERAQLAEERFTAADADGDGQLTQDEMIAAADALERLRREERIASMIEAWDTDANGTLSLDEMEAGGGPDQRGHPPMRRYHGGRANR